jgi:tetratricopeptide (TPR) repeat protein
MVQICDEALRSHPRNIDLLYVSAIALLKLKRLTESLRRFDKLLALQPDHLVAINERGCVLAEMKEYEALAIELALNRGKLLSIQEKLRKNRLTTPLFDTALFTKHLEAAYETIYRRYRAGLPPDQIKIHPIKTF